MGSSLMSEESQHHDWEKRMKAKRAPRSKGQTKTAAGSSDPKRFSWKTRGKRRRRDSHSPSLIYSSHHHSHARYHGDSLLLLQQGEEELLAGGEVEIGISRDLLIVTEPGVDLDSGPPRPAASNPCRARPDDAHAMQQNCASQIWGWGGGGDPGPRTQGDPLLRVFMAA
ncbi:hypothetical protein D4764_07G0011520 [Takifugu flavidus]|uniref:Uncharacterized protein n=1 Tax=Takifugu flavidus TaxID=433684 RepID=A0A5C6MTY8_9TELE|nr:hypothetical protein D4764_07G0011520 [Takifugu flavidus]